MVTRDVAREAAERIMANLESLTTGTPSLSSVTVPWTVVVRCGDELVHNFIQWICSALLFLCCCSRACGK